MRMNLGNDFYIKATKEIKELIDSSTSFSVIGISDFGRTVFLKHLSTLPLADKFIFVDIYDLAAYSKIELFRLLLKQLYGKDAKFSSEAEYVAACRKKLAELLQNHKIVIIINRLDLVNFKFDRIFFDNLRSLWNVDNKKIVFIFGVCSPIHNLAQDSMLGTDVLFYSQITYLPLYNQGDLKLLAKTYGPTTQDQDIFERALNLSGGHFQLFQLLLKNKLQQNLVEDDFIRLALKNILRHLNHNQRKILEKISLGKEVVVEDPYLLNTKMVQKNGQKLKLFSPLLETYLRLNTNSKLSAKENLLFKLLKNALGEVVSRDQIFEKVWENNPDSATDWALDALVYRLRKNPAFINSGFILENHKKQGYSLIKE